MEVQYLMDSLASQSYTQLLWLLIGRVLIIEIKTMYKWKKELIWLTYNRNKKWIILELHSNPLIIFLFQLSSFLHSVHNHPIQIFLSPILQQFHNVIRLIPLRQFYNAKHPIFILIHICSYCHGLL